MQEINTSESDHSDTANNKNGYETVKENTSSDSNVQECSKKKIYQTPFCIDALLSNKNLKDIDGSENYEMSEKDYYDNYEDTGLSAEYKRSR